MVEITAIAGALNSLKIALDLTKGAIGVRDAKLVGERLEEIRARLIETQVLVLDAHTTISALLDSERELKRDLAQCRDTARKLKRYEMVELEGGNIGYRIKETARGKEPEHHACPRCYQQAQISIMQPRDYAGVRSLRCPVCSLEIG